jgi:hypothetical protein
MNSIPASAVSAFYSSGLRIENAQFLKNRADQAETFAGLPPAENFGRVAAEDTLAGKALSVRMIPRFLDAFA